MSIDDVLANRELWHVELGDALAVAKMLPDNCLHAITTSPPYFSLRSYLEDDDPNKCLEIGFGGTLEDYTKQLTDLFRELRRALHPSGTLWLNLSTTYAANRTHQVSQSKYEQHDYGDGNSVSIPNGYKPKDLINVPHIVSESLRQDGWYLRQWMPWVVRNKMPESASDRPSTACETVFLLSKESDYFFDMEAVKRKASQPLGQATLTGQSKVFGTGHRNGTCGSTLGSNQGEESRNFRSADLWFDSVGLLLASHLDGTDDATPLGLDIPTKSYRGSHFAVFPERLVAQFVAAGTSECGVCPHCGAPHERIVQKERVATRPGADGKVGVVRKSVQAVGGVGDTSILIGNRDPERHVTRTETVGWRATCSCPAHDAIPAIVFDPFVGSGTTGKVSLDMGRRFLGSELNADYFKLIQTRLRQAKPSLF